MEKAIEYLKSYKKEIDPVIETIFADLVQHAGAISPITERAVSRFHRYMQGGKKHRGALTVFGYELITGEKNTSLEILKASLAIEITHAFALVHDDVMDQDDVRRNNPTIHRQFEEDYRSNLSESDNIHLAQSMAYTLGDYGAYLGQVLLNELQLPIENKERAITLYVNKILEVTLGQMLDITIGIDRPASMDDILLIHRYKTGDYSGSLPMMVGGLLAGATIDEMQPHFEYGVRIGTAFQIRDDEIGLYCETDQIGKPAGSDVRQNKNTILKVKAFELANEQQREILQNAYGNHHLTAEELQQVRDVTKETGAYECSRQMCEKLIQEARNYIPQITSNQQHQELLHSAATFMIERGK